MMVQGAQSPAMSSHAARSYNGPGAGGAPAVAELPQGANDANQPFEQQSRKRKAESQDNERLSKRLSLLNLERGGSKLYVPVEEPSTAESNSTGSNNAAAVTDAGVAPDDDDTMYVDDSKHKVYIYNMDDELSDESDTDDGKLVFLPDIDKHLRESRIPPHILANSDGELAGMQVVLYSDPKSLTVPENRDGVRKAIIESRRRLREQQSLERANSGTQIPVAVNKTPSSGTSGGDVSMDDDVDDEAMDMD